ncbi:AMP-binding protein [Rubrivirga sp. S365]|uniref:acetate--CoA ligase n=1 Tax=Rubrivirga litoralis TaxID=3075598 RepID=A0ABU3BMR8_9BACT|nr:MULTISPECIES: AMP-binding protein [unclassified Rubrivirga]MDT0630579.1 AMP-binding protein [Rubrivirga sp. F394]MDT7857709.1 AMP-binding protein [Rubrivirga sp. S365]
MSDFPFGQAVAWSPTPEHVAGTNLARFWRRQGLDSYAALQAWALDDVGRFWDAVLDDLGVEFSTPYTQILDTSGGVERPQWYAGGRMNVTHNALDRWAGTETWDRDAVRYESEEGDVRTMTYAELHQAVEACAAGLRAHGIGRGDAVGLYLPMTPEIVVAFLAIARVGGVVLPLFSGYGAEAVATRLRDGAARALVVADAAPRRGRAVPMKEVADEALADVPSVQTVFVVDRLGTGAPLTDGRDVPWDVLMASGQAGGGAAEDTAAEDMALLLYTSGTTGTPKGAVHTHGGFPIKAAQDMRHPMDVGAGDVVWWMSDMGWMMGPWLVFGALLNGATMVLFDGAPDAAPDGGSAPDRTWALCERHGVTLLGLSPTLVRALMPHGAEPVERHDLSALRAVGSTGSPWDPESWRWLFETVLDASKPILNYSGGTEISGGIVCGNHVEPLKPCGFSGPVVGMDADVVDEAGRPVRGEVGELVVRQPWIGMTRGFWDRPAPASGAASGAGAGAEGGAVDRYHEAYWSRLPGVWVHGDFAAVDADGQWFLLGRSDDTMKVAGKRLGPAEVEAALNADPRVLESAAVGVPDDVKGQAVVAFVVLASGAEASEALRTELVGRVTDALGKALKPRDVRFADALPKTRNAKVMRRVVRAAHLDGDLGNVTALEDPAAVDAIRASR